MVSSMHLRGVWNTGSGNLIECVFFHSELYSERKPLRDAFMEKEDILLQCMWGLQIG